MRYGMTSAERRPARRELLRGLRDAPVYSVRQQLLLFSLVGIAVAIWGAVASNLGLILGGMGAVAVLTTLAVVAQVTAERCGAVERDRMRQEERRAEMAAWPRWKRSAFVVVAVAIGVGAIALRIWTRSF